MSGAAERFTLWLSGNAEADARVVALLDQAGVPYRQQRGEGQVPRLASASRSLTAFNRRELIEFLWAEGIKLEDS